MIGLALAAIIGFASSPLLTGGLFRYQMDLNFILMRIDGLKDGLLSGEFPVRIQPNWLNGYGYATSIFYGDLFLTVPAVLRILGLSVQGAYFAYQLCVNAATCLIAYYCFKGMFGSRQIALVGSCVYTLSTFRLMLVYVLTRGGMYTAYTFLPLAAYGIYLIYFDCRNQKSWFYLAIGMTGIIQSHLLTAQVTVFTIALIILVSIKSFFQKKRLLAMIKAVAASIVLNIGFLVPLLDYIGDMHVSSDSWKEIWNFIQRKGEDGSGFFAMFREGNSTQAPDMILIFGMLLFLILLVCSDRQEGVKYRKIGSVTGTVSLLLLFMGTKYFPWDQIEICFPNSRMIVNSLQFPHRFYETGIVLMVITLCCGLIMLKEQIGDRSEYRTGVALIFCICLLSAGYILSNLINHESVTKLYNTGDLDDKWINTEEYLPEGAEPELFTLETASAGDGVRISSYKKEALHIQMQCTNEGNGSGYVELPLVYYKGYQARDRADNDLEVICGENKTVVLKIPPNYRGEVSVFFQEPLLWTATFWISVVGAAVMTVKIVVGNKKKRRKSNE